MIFKSYIIENNFDLLQSNIVLFYGENLGLKFDLKRIIKSKHKAEIVIFSQEEILKNEANFFDEFLNISLFNKEKIYFIDPSDDKILDLIKDIETKITDQKIYLFADTLEKKSKLRNHFENSKVNGIVACYSDNELNIKKIILRRLNGFNGLSSENVNLIIDNCNYDRVKLNNELDKIVAFFENKKLIREKLELLLDAKTNDNFNLLKDTALNGEKTKTNYLLSETLIENDKNIYYLNVINQRLNKIYELKLLDKKNDPETAINLIKPQIFWKDKSVLISQAKKWDKNKISKVLNETYDLEIKMKSNTTVSKNILIKKLIIDICNMANSS